MNYQLIVYLTMFADNLFEILSLLRCVAVTNEAADVSDGGAAVKEPDDDTAM